MACINPCVDMLFVIWREKAWPAGAGSEFLFGGEERQRAADTVVYAWLLAVVHQSAERGFGALLPCYRELLRREMAFPFIVGLDYFFHILQISVFVFSGGKAAEERTGDKQYCKQC